MTNSVYINGRRPSSVPTHLHRRPLIVGSAHSGPHWTNAVRILRSATQNAVVHAGWRRSITTDHVGTTIIDGIGELDGKSLHVLGDGVRDPGSNLTAQSLNSLRRRRKCRRQPFYREQR